MTKTKTKTSKNKNKKKNTLNSDLCWLPRSDTCFAAMTNLTVTIYHWRLLKREKPFNDNVHNA